MTSILTASAVLLLALSSFQSLQATDPEPAMCNLHSEKGSDVVAEIGSHKITRDQLEQREAGKLLQARQQLYVAERDSLTQFVDEYVVEQKAAQEHLTVDQLLARDVDSHVQSPSEEALHVYYEGLTTDKPFAEVHDEMLAYIRKNRAAKLKAEYVKNLRDQAGITIALAPPSMDVSVAGASLQGPEHPAVTVIEFADYECPYCRQVNPLLKKLSNEYGGKIAIAYKDMPLPMHRNAEKAAEAARCAGKQGRFWEFHDALFEESGKLEISQLKQEAQTLKLDTAKFNRCLDAGEEADAVHENLVEAQRLGLTGTPSFFVNGHFLSGAVKYEALKQVVDQEIHSPKIAAAAH